MNDLKSFLPLNIVISLEKGNITTIKEILILSIWDIKKFTGLSTDDIMFIKSVCSDISFPELINGFHLTKLETPENFVRVGCPVVDTVLNGGLKRGTITELYGESGSGKTQIALHATIHNWSAGCVYICTEDMFPIKRFEQIKQALGYIGEDCGHNIFIEQITEASELNCCIKVRLPNLLHSGNFSLIVIDSIAAPYRTEGTNYIQRAEELKELACTLINIALTYNLAILCINQVSGSLENFDSIIPSLGLAWSNMVSTRVQLRKTSEVASINTTEIDKIYVRELNIIYSPYLPNSVAKFIITSRGIQSIT